MRKVTRQAVQAFNENRNLSVSNTTVKADSTGTYMYLFGNLIARKVGNRVQVTLAGYNTNTTKERLNGLAGVSISQANFIPYFNGKEMDLYEWYQVES